MIDHDKFISYRWLANDLQISVDVAKKVMTDYINENPDINIYAMYCVSGIMNETNEYQMFIVPYTNLDNTKKRFLKVLSSHIYSLHHKLPSTIASQLKNDDSSQAKDLLALQPAFEFFLLNKLGHIVNNDISIKPIGQKYVIAQMSTDSIIDPIKSAIRNPPASKGTKKVSANDFFNSTKASNIANDEKKKAEKIKELDDILDFSSSKASKISKDIKLKTIGGDDGEDAEWDDGSGYRTNKDNLKKRKAINIPDEDCEDNVQKMDEEADVVAVDEDEKENKKLTKKTYTHGAMDDYMEDVAIAKHIASQESGGNEIAVKKTKKKLVQKTVCDEKSGYIETVFEYEEVTDDEADKPPPPKNVSKPPPPKATAAKSSNKKGSPDKNKPAQKSMMSFFGAKK